MYKSIEYSDPEREPDHKANGVGDDPIIELENIFQLISGVQTDKLIRLTLSN
jgi:hypothetical protein